MPEPGVVRQPEYKRGASLPYGGATQANAMDPEATPPLTPEEEFLYGPTMRPAEPVTAGAPFGEGPNYVMQPRQTDQQVLARVAETVEASPLSNNPEVRGFIDKVRRGL